MNKISSFANRLQELLEIKGITKAELSRMTDINKSSLTHYVKGDWEGKQDAVYAIARATDISEAWLMGYDVPMTKKESRQQEIAQIMKNFRIEAGLTQLQVAEKLGITCQDVDNYEQGTSSIEPHLFNAMCSFYHVSPKSFLSADEETEVYDALFEMMMSKLQPKKKRIPSISSEAMKLAKDYDGLDGHGQRMLRLVADEEKARCEEEKGIIQFPQEVEGEKYLHASRRKADKSKDRQGKTTRLTDDQADAVLDIVQSFDDPDPTS